MSKLPLNTGRVEQKRKTRDEILKTAQKLLEEGKLFTLDDVASHCNMSRATVYRYFSSVDLLCAEAALNVKTKSKNDLLSDVEHLTLEESVLYIQEYFNKLAQNHEAPFRKYLSVVLNESLKNKNKKLRGARRPEILQSVIDTTDSDFNEDQLNKLRQIVTVLSGIEPLISNRDVNGINNKKSNELLNWALKMILKGMKNTDPD